MDRVKGYWSRISLAFLFLVALMGTALRATPFISLPLEYMNLVHSHSHVAFQGWVYTLMILLLTKTYLNPDQIETGRYALQFKLSVIVVFGVMISFALQGYGLYSILFSTLFQLLNYWFIFRFFKDIGALNESRQNSLSLRFVKTGLWLGLLSTLLPIGIGVLSAKGMSESQAYQSLVYSFLHLQYNGWFLFVILGLFIDQLDSQKIRYSQKRARTFYLLMNLAVIPSISLSLLGMDYSEYVKPIGYISALLLGAALFYFIKALPTGIFRSLSQLNVCVKVLTTIFVICFCLKTTLQVLSVFEVFEVLAFHNRFIIIGYLHLSLIGSISIPLIGMIYERQWLPIGSMTKTGLILLVSGFALTELLLMLTGFGKFYSAEVLLLGSVAMALGILLMILNSNKAVFIDSERE